MKKRGFVYIIKSLHLYKIGACSVTWTPPKTIKNCTKKRETAGIRSSLYNRLAVYKTSNPHDPILIAHALVSDCFGLEAKLHSAMAHKKVRGEWFDLSEKEVEGIIEIMDLDNQLLA